MPIRMHISNVYNGNMKAFDRDIVDLCWSLLGTVTNPTIS